MPIPARTIATTAELSFVRNTYSGVAPDRPQRGFHRAVTRVVVLTDQRLADEPAHAHRAVVDGVERGDDDERVAVQDTSFELIGERSDHERQLQLAVEQLVDQLLLVVGLERSYHESGMITAELVDDGREDSDGDALEGADVEATGVAAAESVDIVGDRVDPAQDVACVLEHQLAERCELDGPRATRAVEERSADESLEGRDLLAHRRLRVAETLGRATERALGGDGVEGDQVSRLELSERLHDHQHS